jgi:hypothetical protein
VTHGRALQRPTSHWNGVRWSLARAPALGDRDRDGEAGLTDVAFSSANDGWVLGAFCWGGSQCLKKALHCDGSRWTEVSMPPPAKSMRYGSIVALSPADAWVAQAAGIGRLDGEAAVFCSDGIRIQRIG